MIFLSSRASRPLLLLLFFLLLFLLLLLLPLLLPRRLLLLLLLLLVITVGRDFKKCVPTGLAWYRFLNLKRAQIFKLITFLSRFAL